MNRKVKIELYTRWLGAIDDIGLQLAIGLLETSSPTLIRGAFQTGQGECLATLFGSFIPGVENGPAFLDHIGVGMESRVMAAWESDPSFAGELLTVLRSEA